MSRKNTLKYELLAGQSLTSSFLSPATFVRNADNISYQINVTTTNSTGNFQIQVSDDYSIGPDNTVTNPGSWLTLTLSGNPVVNATDDVIGISLTQLPYEAIRISYTAVTPGTGTCSAIITTKQVGG